MGDEIMVTNRKFTSYGAIGVILKSVPNISGLYSVQLREETDARGFLPSSIEKFPKQEMF
jgi:hypothetical protein